MRLSTLASVVVCLCAAQAVASQEIKWEYDLGVANPSSAAASTFLYGKSWTYTVELDDGGIFAKTIAQPLLAQFKFTDAPPGVAGGRELPFVGSVALMACNMNGGNGTVLTWADVKELRAKGWDMANHSYWHTGNHWDKAHALTPEQFRRELYWSQEVFGNLVYDGRRAPIHFVYPSGDFNYEPFLKEFGILSGSRVSGSSPRSCLDPKFNPLELGRVNLDNPIWEKNGDPMMEFPKDQPKEGTIHIDFTHVISKKDSVNYKRWGARLAAIAEKYGKGGLDNLWSAPNSEVTAYREAAKAAKVSCVDGRLSVALPSGTLESRLTIVLDGVPEGGKLEAPKDGLLYRQGAKVWITTPPLGSPPPLPKPGIKIGYEGKAEFKVDFGKTLKLAGVRVQQSGNPDAGFAPKFTVILPDGSKQDLDMAKIHKWVELKSRWGFWNVYPLLPDEAPVDAVGLEMAMDPSLKSVEAWTLDK